MPSGQDGGGGRALVIVPTYNERDSLPRAVERVFEAVPEGVDVLVVDDSSPDGTAAVARDLAARDERVHLLERPGKAGLGRAYVAGFRWALERGYDAVVEMDADLSHDPADIPRLLGALDRADLVVGSRYVPGGRTENWGLVRRLLSRFGNLYARAWLGFSVRDSTSGYRAFRSETLRAQDLDSVHAEGYAFQIEMVRRIHRAGRRIEELPITFVERELGRSKMSRRIVLEALVLVAATGIKDRIFRRGSGRRTG